MTLFYFPILPDRSTWIFSQAVYLVLFSISGEGPPCDICCRHSYARECHGYAVVYGGTTVRGLFLAHMLRYILIHDYNSVNS